MGNGFHLRIPVEKVNNFKCCPMCESKMIVFDRGDYIAKAYCLNCPDWDEEFIIIEEVEQRYHF